jgi:hypothetical protein
MGYHASHSCHFQAKPPLASGTQVTIGFSALSLLQFGFNISIETQPTWDSWGAHGE